MHLSRFRPRFTLRGLMVAVAIFGLMFGFGMWMSRRSAEFHKKAKIHMRMIPIYTLPRIGRWKPPGYDRIEWARVMARKYRYAARYPWLPVAPDPPEPK